MTNKRITTLLAKCDLAFTNILTNDFIRPRMAKHGYDADRLAEGQRLHSVAVHYDTRYDETRKQRISLTRQVKATHRRLHRALLQHIDLVRSVLADVDGIVEALNLDGPWSRPVDLWLKEAGTFYTRLTANEAWMGRLDGKGELGNIIRSGAEAHQALAALRQKHLSVKGEVEAMSRARKQAVAALEAWMATMRRVAGIALDENKEYLEMLGVPVRSSTSTSRNETPQDESDDEPSDQAPADEAPADVAASDEEATAEADTEADTEADDEADVGFRKAA